MNSILYAILITNSIILICLSVFVFLPYIADNIRYAFQFIMQHFADKHAESASTEEEVFDEDESSLEELFNTRNYEQYDTKLRKIQAELDAKTSDAEVLEDGVYNLPHNIVLMESEVYPTIEREEERGQIETAD